MLGTKLESIAREARVCVFNFMCIPVFGLTPVHYVYLLSIYYKTTPGSSSIIQSSELKLTLGCKHLHLLSPTAGPLRILLPSPRFSWLFTQRRHGVLSSYVSGFSLCLFRSTMWTHVSHVGTQAEGALRALVTWTYALCHSVKEPGRQWWGERAAPCFMIGTSRKVCCLRSTPHKKEPEVREGAPAWW